MLDTTTTSLHNNVMEIRARLITDLRRDVQSLNGALHEAMTCLPSSTTSPSSIGDTTPATSDPVVGIATGDSYDPADPAIGLGLAPTGDSSVHATNNPTPVDGPHVRFQRAHMPPSPAPHADSSRFHSGNSVYHVTPGPDRVRHPPPMSTSDYSPRGRCHWTYHRRVGGSSAQTT